MSAKLVVAAGLLRKAQAAYEKTLREEYPIGSGIRWVHNRHSRSGQVICHGYGNRLQVRNDYTGKTYWIRGHDVIAAYADAELGATA
jgi:hypothetical protein